MKNRKKCFGLLAFNTEISSDTKVDFGSVCSDSKTFGGEGRNGITGRNGERGKAAWNVLLKRKI